MTWIVGTCLLTLAVLMGTTCATAYACGRYAVCHGAPQAVVSEWFRRGAALYLREMPINLLGLLVVAIALPFRTSDASTSVPFTLYPELGNWQRVNLPAWAERWDNPCDGMLGDKRGWFANWCAARGWRYPSWLSMWWWAAIRNPANYYSRITTAIDITDATLRMLAGTSAQANENEFGWHFIIAEKDGRTLGCLFQAAIPYPFAPGRGFYCRFGYKIELDEPQTQANDLYERLRSSVWKCSAWKDLS